jgi:pimeloyl-ACP methyl ester carboxylesterase
METTISPALPSAEESPVAAAVAGPSFEGDVIDANGTQLYYETGGAGEPLLLLHHFGGCSQVWEPHRDAFAAQYRLIIVDLPGHGRSSNAKTFTHRQAATDLWALLDAIGVKRTRAIGLSSGAMTLLHMATQQPARMKAMVLVGATTHFPSEARAIFARSAPDKVSSTEFDEWNRCSSRGEQQTRDLFTQFSSYKDNYDDMNFTEQDLSTISARSLIVHGDHDDFFPVSIPFQVYRAIPSAELWIVPGGDHIPVFGRRAPAFQAEVLRFLSKARRGVP